MYNKERKKTCINLWKKKNKKKSCRSIPNKAWQPVKCIAPLQFTNDTENKTFQVAISINIRHILYNKLSPIEATEMHNKQWFHIPPAIQTKPLQANMTTNKNSIPKKHKTQIPVIPQHRIMPQTVHGMPDTLPGARKPTASSSCTLLANFASTHLPNKNLRDDSTITH
jgi:hypothetical protein